MRCEDGGCGSLDCPRCHPESRVTGSLEEGTARKCADCGRLVDEDLAADMGWQRCDECGEDWCPGCAGTRNINGRVLCAICARFAEESNDSDHT